MFRSDESLRIGGQSRRWRSGVPATMMALALFVSGCSKHNASGEYIATTRTAVARLQLVETPDNRLSGQIEASVLQPDGKIQYINSAVGGAADGSNVSLTLETAGPLRNSVQVSGTFSGDSLSLTGGFSGTHSSTFVMRGGDLDQYRAALVGLNKRAMAILAARRLEEEEAAKLAKQAAIAAAVSAMQERVIQDQQNFAHGVQVLCDKMQKFETAGSSTLQKLPAVTAKYRAITTKMEDYLRRDRTFAGISRASYPRSQISYAMGNGIYATNQVHFEVQSLQSDFVSDVQPQMQFAEKAMRLCSNTTVPVPTVTPACQRLQNLFPAYSKAYQDVATGLADLESIYQTELRKQQQLKSEADQIN